MSALRGMYLHAERLLAKAGGSKAQGEGYPHPWSGAEGAEGGAQRRSAQAKRGRLGKPLAPRDRGRALSEVCLPYACASAHRNFRVGVAGRNRPAEVGGGRRQSGWRQGGAQLLPAQKKIGGMLAASSPETWLFLPLRFLPAVGMIRPQTDLDGEKTGSLRIFEFFVERSGV